MVPVMALAYANGVLCKWRKKAKRTDRSLSTILEEQSLKNSLNKTFLTFACFANMLLFPAYPSPIKVDDITYVIEGQAAEKQSFQNFHHAVIKAKRSVEQTFAQDFRMPITIVITRDAPQFTKLTGLNWKTGGIYDKRRKQLVLQNLNSLFKQGIVTALLKHELCHAMFGQLKFNDVVKEEALCLAFAGLSYELTMLKKLDLEKESFKRQMAKKIYAKGRDRQNAYALLSLWGAELLSRKPMGYWVSNQNSKLESDSYKSLREKLNQSY